MSLRRICVALLALTVFCVVPTSASATESFESSGSAWYTGASPGTKLKEGESRSAKASAATTFFLTSVIAGVNIKKQAGGFECVSCKIQSTGGKAVLSGKLKLTSVKLIEPSTASCSVPSTFETKQVTGTVGMLKGSSTKAAIKFVPTEGETFGVTEIIGEACAIKGLYKLTGTVFAELTNSTGVFATKQSIVLSRPIQETYGTSTSLRLGSQPAFLTGTANLSVESEPEFAVEEK